MLLQRLCSKYYSLFFVRVAIVKLVHLLLIELNYT